MDKTSCKLTVFFENPFCHECKYKKLLNVRYTNSKEQSVFILKL